MKIFLVGGPEDQERAYHFIGLDFKINSEIEKENKFTYNNKPLLCKCFLIICVIIRNYII